MTLPKDPARREEYLRLLSVSHKGQHSSVATEFKRGQTPHNKGKTLEELYGVERAGEIKGKNSKAHDGQKPWHTGKHWPEWVRRKMSEAHKGKLSPRRIDIPKSELKELYWNQGLCLKEVGEKYGVSEQIVWKRLAEYEIPRRSNGETHKGQEPWNKGLHMWEDHPHPRGMLGKELRDSAKEKISEALKGKPKSSEHVRNVLRANAVKPNKAELHLLSILQRANPAWRYVGDGALIIEGKCPDFWDGDGHLVELYGEYWHRGDDPQERIDFFGECGYHCLVIWERETKEESRILEKVQAKQGA